MFGCECVALNLRPKVSVQNVLYVQQAWFVNQMSRLVEKPKMWFRTRSDTNQVVQPQKLA